MEEFILHSLLHSSYSAESRVQAHLGLPLAGVLGTCRQSRPPLPTAGSASAALLPRGLVATAPAQGPDLQGFGCASSCAVACWVLLGRAVRNVALGC